MKYHIVSTIGQKCKRCYSCIRECPAAAIRVMDGQAVVLSDRCISCGHCVKVCSQNAKEIYSEVDKVMNTIIPTGKGIAIVAPSFAASFPDNYNKIPTALKKLGFIQVCETAFGADLISEAYKDVFENTRGGTIISSPCPAVYNFIEKYHAELVPNLAKIVSPMIAMGRYLKENLGEDTQVVFIGPCVAKKSEAMDENVSDAIEGVLTFFELKEMFEIAGIDLDELEHSDFDPPYANLGKSFPLAGGLLKTAGISSDILRTETIIVEGVSNVKEIIQDISDKKINAKFVDILFCEGCINGPALDSDLNLYSRREKVIEYIDENISHVDKQVWKSEIYNNRHLNFKRDFTAKSQRRPMPSEERIKEILAKTNKFEKSDELNCGSCGYPTCREYAIAIAKDLAEEDMCLPYLIEKLEIAYTELKTTQEQLANAEKLASIGQLAAGVAHEINNPLGTIMLYSSMLKKDIAQKINDGGQSVNDLKMIIEEADRCKSIVANLLNFARQGKLIISKVDVEILLGKIIDSIKLDNRFADIKIVKEFSEGLKPIEADQDQLKQVLLNLVINACESMEESIKKELIISLRSENGSIKIEIKDSGCGIPEENLKKLFTPFFTTKKIGKGTGLGLPISYGIIKMHKGDIKVKSNVSEGTEFHLTFPKMQTSKTYTEVQEI